MNTAPRMNFYLRIGARLYGESCLPTLGSVALREAAERGDINLGYAEGALALRCGSQELFGLEWWDYIQGYTWEKYFNDLLAGIPVTHAILSGGFYIEMIPQQESLYLKTYFVHSPERLEQEAYLPLIPFIQEATRFTHRFFRAAWLWDPDVSDYFQEGWADRIQGAWRDVLDLEELTEIMERDLTDLLKSRDFYQVYEQTRGGFVRVEDWNPLPQSRRQ